MPDPTAARLRQHWRNPLFLLVFVPGALVWLAFVGWLTWLTFHPVMDWIGLQHEILQELLGLVVLVVWALFLAFGVGGAAYVAEGAAGLRPSSAASFPPPAPPGAGAKKWERGRNTTADSTSRRDEAPRV